MPRAPIPLALQPDRCEKCRRCLEACPPGALKVGPTYILVDWRTCDGCLACAKACASGAITARSMTRVAAGDPRSGVSAKLRPPGSTRVVKPRASRPVSTAGGVAGGVDWTLTEAWVVIVVLLVTFLAKDAVLASASVTALHPDLAVFARVGTLFGFYALQACVLALLAWRRRVPVLEAFGLRAPHVAWPARLASVVMVVALLVGTRLVALAYGMTAQEAGWEPPARGILDLTEMFGPTVWGLIFSVALVVVVAPIIEEVLFRGVIQGALMPRVGYRVAIAAAAALFALSHVTAWLLLPLFVLGVACGWLAHTRSSLLPAIWLHAAYNLLPVIVAFYLVW